MHDGLLAAAAVVQHRLVDIPTGMLICSPCSMSVMERRLTASSTAFLMWSR